MSEQQQTDGGPLGRDEGAAPADAGFEPARSADGPLESGPVAAGGPAKKSRKRRRIPAPFVLLVALALAGVIAAVWWQARREPEPVASTPPPAAAAEQPAAAAVEPAPASTALAAELEAVQDRVAELAQALEAERRAREALGDRIAPLPARLADFDRRLATLQGAPFEARTEWLRAQAEYYLAVAGSELALGGRWDNALAALGLADDLLADLGDPSLLPVREAIAAERLALTSVERADLEGVALTLGQLAARAGDLPLRAELPANYVAPAAAVEEQEPGMGRLLATVKGALTGLVRVERRSAPAPELTAAERNAVRRQLELELTLARVAAAGNRAPLYQDSLRRALDLLRRDFDPGAAEVQAAIALLEELAATEVAPERPALGQALRLLRGISAGGE